MRIAIISDIHGNLTALDAVLADLRQQKLDLIFHGGDLPYGGSNPAEVIDCIVAEGWKGVLGNTDEMLWDSSARPALEASAPKLKPLFRVLFDLCGPATTQMIGPSRLAWLRALPMELRHDNLLLMHASPGNARTHGHGRRRRTRNDLRAPECRKCRLLPHPSSFHPQGGRDDRL
jgi:3',5'-cyclic AMP phosphodiesterase CpdA